MKKLTVLAFAAAIALGGATSCKKVRTCSCADGTSFPMASAKKSDQKKACDAYGVAAGTSCNVK